MKRSSMFSLLLGLCWVIPAGAVQPVLDQRLEIPAGSKIAFESTHRTAREAQTFTVGSGGHLAQVDLELCRYADTGHELVLRLCKVGSEGTPLDDPGSLLATLHKPASEIPQFTFPPFYSPKFTSFDLSSFDLPVQAGDRLALVLSSEEVYSQMSQAYLWRSTLSGMEGYAEGSSYGNTSGSWSIRSTDHAFRTYVAVPEPAAVGVGTLGLLVLWPRRVHRRATW